MSIILGLSGKKQSGKNTCLNWILANYVVGLGLVEKAMVDEKGRLIVAAETDGQITPAILDVDHPAARDYLSEYVWPFVKNYSFATPLKTFCMQVFGLTYEQVYGTNEQKNTPTQLRWEDMPGLFDSYGEPPRGYMTARAVLQYFGSNVCRKMYSDCWVAATIGKIARQNPQLAVITDVRFPNEVKGIQAAGGKVLRFTRSPFAKQDEHVSETALDDYDGFDAVLDNSAMSIVEQNKAVTQQLLDWQFVTWAINDQYNEVDAK